MYVDMFIYIHIDIRRIDKNNPPNQKGHPRSKTTRRASTCVTVAAPVFFVCGVGTGRHSRRKVIAPFPPNIISLKNTKIEKPCVSYC